MLLKPPRAMARTIKCWKFLVHAFCILLIGRAINESSLNYASLTKVERFIPDLKHILIWTNMHDVTDEGQRHFIKKKCNKINCYFTKNRSLFGDIRYFDAIVFNLQDLSDVKRPQVRGLNQKYIFAANDSADKYPVCDPAYDDFFNWTWTYKIDSTIKYRFISVFNMHSQELGSNFHWNNMLKDPVDRNFQSLLSSKSKAAAVLLDVCKTKSNREGFIQHLQRELSQYNLTVDIYGKCGMNKCKRKYMGSCAWRLKKQYFFLLAMEDSLAADFVTDVVLPAYHNNAVPIVYGGADYSKFLPPGSFINALDLSVSQLAKSIYVITQDRTLYYDFFKWRSHYSIVKSTILDACVLCEHLNQPSWLIERSSYNLLRQWWLPDYEDRCQGH